jgi:hypothetical protein
MIAYSLTQAILLLLSATINAAPTPFVILEDDPTPALAGLPVEARQEISCEAKQGVATEKWNQGKVSCDRQGALSIFHKACYHLDPPENCCPEGRTKSKACHYFWPEE